MSELRATDLMTSPVHTLSPTQSLPLAESVMEMHHVRHIPVVDDAGRVVGLVTHRDLLAAKISTLTPITEDERSSLQLAVPVARIMRTSVWTIAPEAPAVNAARIMREHGFGCLPVVQGERLVGILTEADLLALVTDSLDLTRPTAPWTMEHVMTRVPVTITPDTPISEARAAMSRYRIRHLPVVVAGKPLSMVTDRDLRVAETIFPETAHTAADHVVRLLGHAYAPHVSPLAPVDAVLRDMAKNHDDAVLVVDDARLVGIFTATDACRILGEAYGKKVDSG
jgi:CBS domain-containing membrane protein